MDIPELPSVDAPPASATLELLVIGDVLPDLASHGHTIVEGDESMIASNQWDAVAFTASLSSDAVVRRAELRVVDAALRFVQAQAVLLRVASSSSRSVAPLAFVFQSVLPRAAQTARSSSERPRPGLGSAAAG